MNAMVVEEKKQAFLVPEEKAILMIEACSNEIFKATTIADVQKTITQAEAVAAVVRSLEASERVKRDAEFLRLRAERQLGTITSRMPTLRGKNGKDISLAKVAQVKSLLSSGMNQREAAAATDLKKSTVNRIATGKWVPPATDRGKIAILAEHGITENRASYAERLARMPEKDFESRLSSMERPSMHAVLERRAGPRKAASAHRFAGEAICLLRVLVRERRHPHQHELNAFELKFAALNVTK